MRDTMFWELGWSDSLNASPETFMEAAAPSDVQLVCREKLGLPDFSFGSNYREYRWMEDKFWHYRTRLFIEKREGLEPVLEFKGINYRYTIRLDGETVREGEGLYTPVRLDLRRYEGAALLVEVVIHPAPKKPGAPEGRWEAAASCIPPVSYGWDWHPRLIPLGLYDEAVLTYRPLSRIETADISYALSAELEQLTGEVRASICRPAGTLTLRLTDGDGRLAAEETVAAEETARIPFRLSHPRLWWCRGQGEAHLYTLTLTLDTGEGADTWEKRIGFRRVRLVMNEGAWEGPSFPKTQGKAPVTMELNGRRIFCKGTNFVPPEIFPSRLGREVYEPLLTLARDAHMNLLRLWGGGIVEKESFFELCDELGLMVWQEFPLACCLYEDDPAYLRVLDQESRSILRRLKPHPSVVLWCGGNELLVSWGGMTNQSLALRLLDRNCLELDPLTPFLPSSPLYGMGHGHYLPLSGPDREFLSDMIDSDFTAYTEFGMPAPATLDYIRAFTPEEELQTPAFGTAWEAHHAVGGWENLENTWFCRDAIRRYFGEEQSLEALIANGRLLQAEVYAHLFEEARRKWPRTSMALNWCYNEPWPTAANNSVLSYPALPKPGYDGVRKALRDQCLSARLYKMRWETGETVEAEVFVLNDLPVPLEPVTYTAVLTDGEGRTLLELGRHTAAPCPENAVCRCGSLSFAFPPEGGGRLWLELRCERETLSNRYLLLRKEATA